MIFWRKMMNKGTAIVGFLLSFLAGLGLMWGIVRQSPLSLRAEAGRATPADVQANSPIPITADDPQWGEPDSPVTIVELSDFQCPYCARVTPTLARVKKEYGPERVRIVWKNNPLGSHQNARPAAVAGATVHALGGDFWKFNDLAFTNQDALNPANFQKWAEASGVDPRRFEASFVANQYAAKVDRDMALARTIGARGAPYFRINGKALSGAQPYEVFKASIDEQLAAGATLMKSGVPRQRVSLDLTRKNFAADPAVQNPPAKAPAPPPEDVTTWKIPVSMDDPVKGPADALVTIVEFSDFQCPFCSRVEPTLQKVMDTYGGDVRLVWKDAPLPFHPRARPAATLARVAQARGGSARFWTAQQRLFESQKNLDDAGLQSIAAGLGLQWDSVAQAIERDLHARTLDANLELATEFDVVSTPQFFINGRRLIGAQPFEKFKALIDSQLSLAKALVDRGVARDKVFRELMKTAKAAPEPEQKVVPKPGPDTPFKGRAGARIVIQEFSDFQCPFCSRVTPTLEQILKAHPDEVQIYFRHLPMSFHDRAELAAEAAQEAYAQRGSAGFFAYHDKLFANQKALEQADLLRYAGDLGFDVGRFTAALEERVHRSRVESDARVATQAGIVSTPGFVVNGYYVSGAQPFAVFDKMIRLAMKQK
jgi:protein-disulfide isomerase